MTIFKHSNLSLHDALPIYTTRKYFFDGLRREWPVLHNEAEKYFLVSILKVAPSKKLSLVDQCLENVTFFNQTPTQSPPHTPPTPPKKNFFIDYVGNGLFYTMK